MTLSRMTAVAIQPRIKAVTAIPTTGPGRKQKATGTVFSVEFRPESSNQIVRCIGVI